MMAKVAFLGLGTMGAPMARNVVKAGHETAVFDVHRPAMESFRDIGARLAASPGDAAKNADIVVTVLPTSEHVDDAMLGHEGAAEQLCAGSLLVDCTTADPVRSVALAQKLAARGIGMVDAALGRPPWDAEAGTLMFMVGGSDPDVDKARAVLDCMGNEIIRCGAQGNGTKVKVINNYMSVCGMVLAAETLAFGSKAGIDRDVLVKVLQSTVAGRGAINVLYPKRVLVGDLSPIFAMRLALKDLGLALNLGAYLGTPLGMGAAGHQELALGKPQGRMDQDVTALLLVLEAISKAQD